MSKIKFTRFNYRQKVAIVLTLMVLLLISLIHIYNNKEIQEAKNRKERYEKVAIVYEKEGIDGAIAEVKKMFADEDYRSSDAFLKSLESKVKSWDNPMAVLQKQIHESKNEEAKFLKLRLKVNIALLAIFIAGLSITVILGIKE